MAGALDVVTITAAREALAAQITANAAGLRTTASVPGQVNPPVGVVRPSRGTFIDYQQTLDGATDLTLEVVLLASTASDRMGQSVMDGLLSSVGPSSVYAAVQADPTLGGLVSYAAVEHGEGYGLIEWGGVEYLGARLIVKIGVP